MVEKNPSFRSLKILGGRVDSITLPEIFYLVENKIAEGKFLQIITVNSLMILETEKDAELQKVFNSVGIAVADSVGILWIAFIKMFQIAGRIPGIDLMISLCKKAEEKGWSVYLLGSRPGVAKKAKENLQKKFPNLKFCGTAHGYFNDKEEKEILLEIETKKPQLIFVGLNVPFQEKWIDRNSSFFRGSSVMGVGGSFDVISDHLQRAPRWIQKIGLEWFFRFCQEPWRWKRVIRLPLLFYKVLLFKPKIFSLL